MQQRRRRSIIDTTTAGRIPHDDSCCQRRQRRSQGRPSRTPVLHLLVLLLGLLLLLQQPTCTNANFWTSFTTTTNSDDVDDDDSGAAASSASPSLSSDSNPLDDGGGDDGGGVCTDACAVNDSTPPKVSNSPATDIGTTKSSGGVAGSTNGATYTVLSKSATVLSATASSSSSSAPPVIDDTLCSVPELEQANDSQLYEILQELKNTNFFRNFVVDLHLKCPLSSWTTSRSTGSEEEEQDDFECEGGKEELDEDAEPLCTVQSGSDHNNPFGGGSNFMGSNALHNLQSAGFESQAQKDTFAWSDVTDAVITEVAAPGTGKTDESVLVDEDTFWNDMCSSIGKGKHTKNINLALNPEHNTGYNGTHIWKAIYEENCVLDENDESMCLEERVLYKLLSGLHTSTTISIAHKYYPPSKRKNRIDWEANPEFYMERFDDNPDHLHNLHFAYVVMLRALSKATPFLYDYKIKSSTAHNTTEDDTIANFLLKRLLDSSILKSCSSVFSAFDENQLFQYDKTDNVNIVALQHNFKGVFHNVSSILDCVQCEQCKLHGKLAMTGYGAALKVLLSKKTHMELEANEIIALVNTIAKLSESLRHARELNDLYWERHDIKEKEKERKAVVMPTVTPSQSPATSPKIWPGETNQDHFDSDSKSIMSLDLVDTAIGLVAALGRADRLSLDREQELVQLALGRHPELLILAKHYQTDLDKFLAFSSSIGALGGTVEQFPDAIVVGSGLAGMAAALNLLDRGGRVIMIEKEHLLGGNSNKASSGINACCLSDDNTTDSMEIFRNDTTRSAGSSARSDLIQVLVSQSEAAVEWLKTRVGVDLSLLAQLGGHSSMRTHRPSNGMAGAEIIYGMQKAVKSFLKAGQVSIMTDTKVTRLLTDSSGSVVGVECVNMKNPDAQPEHLLARNVVLATGGFAADRSPGSYLEEYRPELLKMPTTAGLFSTGDGIGLATELGAGTVDMDKVQVHPTGWVDPADPDNTSKVLAAELMRGVGGLLINDEGERFCNELGTRAYVTNKMLEHDANYAKTGNWSVDAAVPSFSLVLSSSAAADSKKHVDLYSHKGLLTRIEGVTALAKWMGLPRTKVVATLAQYQEKAVKGIDDFGKTTFRGVPAEDLEKEVFYAGKVTPVLHYCMGGITIDVEGNVLNGAGEIIPGLHAAGEVSGGVHGVNRLAGNSLLECTVFGSIVGRKLPVQAAPKPSQQFEATGEPPTVAKPSGQRKISRTELEEHNAEGDCWVTIHGVVYDLTEFAEEHPAGAESIRELAGKDGTEAFAAVHNQGLLEDFDEEVIGYLEA